MDDLIRRADAIEAVCGKCSEVTRAECAEYGYYCCDRRELEALPSAETVHESCEDCPLYDHERHSCPRFNKVIPRTIAEVQGDLISRAEATSIPILPKEQRKPFKSIDDAFETGWNEALACVNMLPSPSAEAKTVDCTDFIRWLTETIMDDGMWELNAVAYGEVIARKLTKLGVLEVKDDVYVYEPSAEAVQGWIPCSERLPKDLEAVNVTWVNHNPPCYYIDIMNVPFTGICVRYKGKWYWWDSTICDVLGEYGEECGAEPIDKYIEVTAWMPLPEPYKGGDE